MIGRLTGDVASAGTDGSILIDVAGVGYVVRAPLLTMEALKSASSTTSLYIHTAVREDAIDLYGFLTEEELLFFKQLMQVSGVGPKTALGIMSVADVSSLKRAIAGGDAKVLTTSFGIGKKSAERLVVELRDKIKMTTPQGDTSAGEDSDVIEALLSLGYSASESRKALREVAPAAVGTRERLAAALRSLSNANVS